MHVRECGWMCVCMCVSVGACVGACTCVWVDVWVCVHGISSGLNSGTAKDQTPLHILQLFATRLLRINWLHEPTRESYQMTLVNPPERAIR